MKYKVRITKQPRYDVGGSPALGDFSNMTQDQLENGPVYGFRSEPEASPVVVVPSNNQRVSMQELPVSAGRIPSYSPNIVPVAMDMKQVSAKPQYKGVSIVDYLNLLGLPTSRAFRTNLAKEYNIKNYTGTAAQNKQLISILDNLKDNFIDFGENKPIVKNNVVRSVEANNNNNAQMADIATDRLRYFTNQKEMADIADERLNYYRPKPQIPVGFDSYIQGAPQNFIKQEGGEQDAQQQVLQIIQAFAQMQGVDPKQVMQKLQQMQPQEQQQIVQQMMQAVQQGQQQAQQQGPQEGQMEGMQGQNPEEEQMEPQMAYGGQMGYGLDLGARRLWMNQNSDDNSEVTDSIEEVPREQANIEAEGGETALIPYQKDGTYIHKKIKGNRHTEGGVPLNVPEGTFIYSDTKKMKLGGPVLQMFGKSEKSTKKFTPATLAKQYNIDKYKAIMDDPKSDPIKKRTAELMLQNFQKKLSQLALVQESKKGFPQGIPEVARDYYQQMQQMQQAKQGGQSVASVNQSQQQGEQPQAMYGMGFRNGGGTPETRALGDDLSIANAARRIYLNPGDLDNWMNQVGRINPITQIARGISSGIVNTGAFLGNRNLQHEVDNTDSIYQNQKRLLQSRGVPFEYGGGLYKAQTGTQYPTISDYTSNSDNWVNKNWEGFPYSYNESNKTDLTKNDLLGQNEGPRSRIPMDEMNAAPGKISNGEQNLEIPKTSPYTDVNAFTKRVSDENKNFTSATPVYEYNNLNGTSDIYKEIRNNLNRQLAGNRTIFPFQPNIKLGTNQTVYANPAGGLAALAEQANSARQTSAMFSGPQSRYINSGLLNPSAFTNWMNQTANQNASTFNNASLQNNAINNQQMQYDANRSRYLYDGTTNALSNRRKEDNALMNALSAARVNEMDTNIKLRNLNATQSPFFGTDRNGNVVFKSNQARTDFFNAKNNQDANPFFKMVNMLMNDSNGTMTYKEAVEAAAKVYGRQQMNNA